MCLNIFSRHIYLYAFQVLTGLTMKSLCNMAYKNIYLTQPIKYINSKKNINYLRIYFS